LPIKVTGKDVMGGVMYW